MSNAVQLAGGIVGGVIGWFVGGPAGAAWGFQIGVGIGTLIDPGPPIRGPRLDEMQGTVAERGAPVYRIRGVDTVQGTIIWEGPRVEHKKKKKKGGFIGIGGQKIVTFTYTKSVRVGLCSYIGPDVQILRIWENGELVYDIRPPQPGEDAYTYITRSAASVQYAEGMTLYTGADSDMPDPTMEEIDGAGNVIGYRGLVSVMFVDRKLRDDQGSIFPSQWEFEICERSIPQTSKIETVPFGDSHAIVFPLRSEVVDTAERNFTFDVSLPTAAQAPAPGGMMVLFLVTSRQWTDDVAAPTIDQGDVTYAGHELKKIVEYNASYTLGGDPPEDPDGFLSGNLRLVVLTLTLDDKDIAGPQPVNIVTRNNNVAFSSRAYVRAGVTWLKNVSQIVDPVEISNDYLQSNDNTGPFLNLVAFHPPRGAVMLAAVSTQSNLAPPLGFFRPNWQQPALLAMHWLSSQFDSPADGDDPFNPQVRSVAIYLRSGTQTLYEQAVIMGAINANDSARDNFAYTGGMIQFFPLPDPVDDGTGSPPVELDDLVSGLMLQDGLYQPEDFDVTELAGIYVSGYRRAISPVRADLEVLRKVGLFDVVESDTRVYFRRRGGEAVATLTEQDLGAVQSGETSADGQTLPAVTTEMAQDVELPARVTVKYRSPAREYEPGEQASPYRLVTGAVNELQVQVPVAMKDQQAARVADILMRNAWAERFSHQTQVATPFLYLRTADPIIVPVDGRNRRCRIVDIGDSALLLRKLALVRDDDGSYVSDAVAQDPPALPALRGISGSLMLLLDIPMMNNNHNDAGFYAALYPADWQRNWLGAELDWDYAGEPEVVGLAGAPATVGTVEIPAAAGITTTWDTLNTLQVRIPALTSLASSTEEILARDISANAIAVGLHGRWEIMQFLDAELVDTDPDTGEKIYVLSTLLRGRRGTEWVVGSGLVNDSFVRLDDALARVPMPAWIVGVPADYRAVTNGLEYDDAAGQAFTTAGVALKPFAPVDITAEWTGPSVTITWKRRSRFIGEAPDAGGDVPIGETVESYDIELYVGSVLVDSATVTEAEFTSALATEGDTEVRVYQNSALVGRGTAGVANV